MSEYQHVMYASKGSVKQVYSELYGDVSELTVEEGESYGASVGGNLRTFITQLSSEFSGEITESEIKKINFDDNMRKAKRLANEILSDNAIPNIAEVNPSDVQLGQLYRFSCEVETRPFQSEVDDQTYIEVTGKTGDIIFRGDTSTENWGLRSHIIQSVKAAKRGDTYPYQGLMWILSQTDEERGFTKFDVDYLLICGPERRLREEWYDRR